MVVGGVTMTSRQLPFPHGPSQASSLFSPSYPSPYPSHDSHVRAIAKSRGGGPMTSRQLPRPPRPLLVPPRTQACSCRISLPYQSPRRAWGSHHDFSAASSTPGPSPSCHYVGNKVLSRRNFCLSTDVNTCESLDGHVRPSCHALLAR